MMDSAQRKCDARCLAFPLLIYLAGGDFSEPSNRRKNIPPVPWGRGPREPRNSQQRGLGRPIPGTSSSSMATQGKKETWQRSYVIIR